ARRRAGSGPAGCGSCPWFTYHSRRTPLQLPGRRGLRAGRLPIGFAKGCCSRVMTISSPGDRCSISSARPALASSSVMVVDIPNHPSCIGADISPPAGVRLRPDVRILLQEPVVVQLALRADEGGPLPDGLGDDEPVKRVLVVREVVQSVEVLGVVERDR